MASRMFVVPPGGFAGFAQMTPASRAALSGRGPSRGPSQRRRKSSTRRKTRTSRKRAASRGGRKMKFGSPAWQKKYRVGRFAKKR